MRAHHHVLRYGKHLSRSEQEQLSNQRVGYVTSRLGFQKTLFQSRKALIWDPKLVERLKKRYPVQEAQPEQQEEIELWDKAMKKGNTD